MKLQDAIVCKYCVSFHKPPPQLIGILILKKTEAPPRVFPDPTPEVGCGGTPSLAACCPVLLPLGTHL